MKSLKDILYRVKLIEVKGSTDIPVAKICFDSREAVQDSLFVAVKGTQVDGHDYIDQAIEKGATAVACEDFPEKSVTRVTYVKIKDSAVALGMMAGNFYDDPSSKLKLIGITGTNGKTTIATLLFRLFKDLGHKAGLLSTVNNQINDEIIAATHTTGDALQLNSLLDRMVKQGCTYCFMEASSHAIAQHRTTGLHFAGAIFTNLSHDHLDYHKTFDEYIAAKKKLFNELPSDAFALTNVDDKRGRVMVQNTAAKIYTYSVKRPADFRLKILENAFSGLILDIEGQEVYSRLIGEFNAYNLLAVYAATRLLGIEKITALQAISKLHAAEGRFDYFMTPRKKIVGIVDYAHTPDALKKVLQSIKAIRTGNEKVITIVGCGGNRDKDKRPVMAKIACELSDQILLTSDNPRNEDPNEILQQMQAGLNPVDKKKVLSIVDRREAIKTACTLAGSGDIILLAGKGHEKYQEIMGKKYPFDDKQVLTETLKTFDQ